MQAAGRQIDVRGATRQSRTRASEEAAHAEEERRGDERGREKRERIERVREVERAGGGTKHTAVKETGGQA